MTRILLWGVALFALVALCTKNVRAETNCTGFGNEPFALKLTPSEIYVVDGDTIKQRFGCENLRFSDMDAPDTNGHEKCHDEGLLGSKSETQLWDMVRAAKTAEFRYDGKRDNYHRPLGVLILDGKPVRDTLIKDGFACPAADPIKEDWCAKPFKCRAS